MSSRERTERRMKRTNAIKKKSLSTFSPSSSDTILHGGGLCDDYIGKCDASALKKDDSHAGSNPSLFKDLSGTKVLSKTHKHGRSGYLGHMTRVQRRGG